MVKKTDAMTRWVAGDCLRAMLYGCLMALSSGCQSLKVRENEEYYLFKPKPQLDCDKKEQRGRGCNTQQLGTLTRLALATPQFGTSRRDHGCGATARPLRSSIGPQYSPDTRRAAVREQASLTGWASPLGIRPDRPARVGVRAEVLYANVRLRRVATRLARVSKSRIPLAPRAARTSLSIAEAALHAGAEGNTTYL